ncbi:hypothetical protein GC56T2_2420 [Geobacillus sp. C56-T2]|nr:hypothetical protein GC56T2_2420 [Geobacillus sp. C56-T2]
MGNEGRWYALVTAVAAGAVLAATFVLVRC